MTRLVSRFVSCVALAALAPACGGKKSGGAAKAPAVGVPAPPANPLMNPDAPEMKETAPAVYRVKFETSAGDFVIEVTRAWAPNGADRFYNLVRHGFYDDVRFFRVIPNFVVQFGINGDPQISARWRNATMPDDPVKGSNKPGTITFATAGPNSRTTQVFVNYGNNASLDQQGFAPFGRVASGMPVVQRINQQYGDAPSRNQVLIQAQGNAYLKATYPNLDYVKKATLVQE
jgi:peptidyl-prolyl cis-trans isomerase A (cyclophilin A)